ncbi:putative thiazole biosynthetic enzyme [bioreactor metagenome]|uniref:Putative thiazole biosynthetic enzyme n=1 Tax=bioreactor metagenome TaxID=1076179 RepID=A0A644ZCE8_9ZZZZ
MHFECDIPNVSRCDVAIIGGGPAGCAAAVTAARTGAEVCLFEAESAFGGLGTMGGVPLFMNFGDREHFYADGIGREIRARHAAEGVIHGNPDCINAERLKRIYDELLAAAGVKMQLLTMLIGVRRQGLRITAAIFCTRGGLCAIEAGVFIDATGDAALAAMAGGATVTGDGDGHFMPGTLCSGWSHIDWDAYEAQPGNRLEQLAAADRAGVFRQTDWHHTGITPTGRTLGGGNMGHFFGYNPLDAQSLTASLIEGRRQMVEFERFYRDYVPGFTDVELSFTAALPGVRASRRTAGDYVLNLDDYRARRHFADEIGCFNYTVDIHPPAATRAALEEFRRERQSLRYAPGESYGIPYRTLTVGGVDNLLAAGRCISTDRYAQSSIRVMPCCYITGQAAGLAAALAAEHDGSARAIAVPQLQARLRKIGAYLPEADADGGCHA